MKWNQIELEKVNYESKPVLQQLLEFYQYDCSDFESYDLNQHGCYGYKYLDHYWTEEGRFPFFIKVDGVLAGFALVNDYCYTDADFSMAEFFVVKKYRNTGVGTYATQILLERFPGEWEVVQTPNNLPAQRFWKKVIGHFTNQQYKEYPMGVGAWSGPIIRFSSVQEPYYFEISI
ncbi:GNAT family N-acetyltransferase [Hazenella coriacea]|uniref:Putative acetyltransferase n=1 Tax=Hazenella coriacea TaxID=1179467 RepID=A0A4R3LAU4_9BACL|nr:GNAT family N-acetyltransferase [Hazenella coriacea]TCS96388.1 putative acetyltransferase [Hazenella coriacea]